MGTIFRYFIKTHRTHKQYLIYIYHSLSCLFAFCSLTHHSDSIIEQAFTKHHNVELLVHVDILKHGEHSHWVHSRDDGGKEKVLLQVDVLYAKGLDLADGEERDTNADGVPQSPHDGKPQHCANVLKEGASGHEVARVQHDGGQHVEEEDVAGEHGWRFLVHSVHDGPNNEAHSDQQAGFWHPDGDLIVNVETL